MKKFIIKAGLFTVLIVVFCVIADYMSMHKTWNLVIAQFTNSEEFIADVGTDEIKPYIDKVQEQDDTEILIVGDSVCHQMFSGLQEYNDKICIVGSNGAITMAGQYILVEEYVKNHAAATDVYLMVLPESLSRTYDTMWGYQYAVMPFVQTNTLHLLDENTISGIKSSYGEVSIQPWLVKLVDASAVNRKIYFNLIKIYGKSYKQTSDSELADQYISKMYQLCEENGITLHLYACPVADSRQQEMDVLEVKFADSWLKQYYPDYFENIVYFPDKQAADGIHFSGDYAQQANYNEKIQLMLNKSELLETLVLEQ